MDVRAVARNAVVVLGCASSYALANADNGIADDELPAIGRLEPALQCRLGGNQDGVSAPGTADDDEPQPEPLPRRALYEPLVERTARAYGIESALLHAVIAVESSYDAKAVSKSGALGLMQLMPGTARRYDVYNAFDPAQNVRGGARYLRDLLETFDNDLRLVLAAYHAGENAVIRSGYRVPPLKPTVEYVARVLERYRHNRRADMSVR